MSITRRGLLRALPSLPLAGNEIKRQAAKLAGASVLGGSDASHGDAGSLLPQSVPRMQGSALVRFLRGLGGLPKWKLREIRNQARYSRQLDPDIASLRSVSLAGALQMQWRRNEKRLTNDVIGWHEYAAERDDWLRENGVDWI